VSAPTTVQWLRAAVARVETGSGRLAVHIVRRAIQRARVTYRRARGWVGESSGFDKALRLALLAGALWILRKVGAQLGGWALGRIESGAWWWLLWAAAVAWVVAAYRAGRDGWQPKGNAEQPEDAAVEAAEEPAVVSLEKPLLPTFHQLCESLARVGTPHAHIAVVAADLGATPEAVRAALDRHGITVEPVRMRGRGVSTGIKGDALPAPNGPSEGVVAAGQPGNNNSNNAFTLVDDDVNPVRTHVVWHARAGQVGPSGERT
jgi:hypothetical protein